MWSSPSWWSYQCGYLSLNSCEYLSLCTWLGLFGSIPGLTWYIHYIWIGDFLFVAMSTSHLSGLNFINQLFSHCCKLSKSLCRMVWSSAVLIIIYRRQSSANSRVVDETTDGKSLMKSRNKRGSKMVPWGTPEKTVVAADDWPSSTTPLCASKQKAGYPIMEVASDPIVL
jgi:hypothetical protein